MSVDHNVQCLHDLLARISPESIGNQRFVNDQPSGLVAFDVLFVGWDKPLANVPIENSDGELLVG